MLGRPALMEYTTVLLFIVFFIVVNKISIHPSIHPSSAVLAQFTAVTEDVRVIAVDDS